MARPGKNSAHAVEEWLIRPADRPLDDAESDDLAPGEGEHSEAETGDGSIGADVAQWLVGTPEGSNGNATKVRKAPAVSETPAVPETPTDSEPAEAELALVEQRAKVDELEKTLRQRETDLAAALRERDEALEERESAVEERLSKSYEKREADLEEGFDERQAALAVQLEQVEERLDIREAELRQQARQRESELQSRIEELESALAEAQQRAIAKPAPRRAARKNGKLDLNEATFEQLRDLGLSVTLSARVISYRDSRGGFESIDELDEIPGLSAEFKRVLSDQLKLG